MKCPDCSTSIAWWRAATITRWTFVRCPNCRRQYGRRITGLQFWLVGGVVAIGSFVLTQLDLARAIQVALFVLLLVVVTFIDAATITLVREEPAGRKRSRK